MNEQIIDMLLKCHLLCSCPTVGLIQVVTSNLQATAWKEGKQNMTLEIVPCPSCPKRDVLVMLMFL